MCLRCRTRPDSCNYVDRVTPGNKCLSATISFLFSFVIPYDKTKAPYSAHLIVVLRKEWNPDASLQRIQRGFEMTFVQLLHALPLGSAIIAGAGVLAYLIYMSSEYHPSARPRRTPRE
jgi:hypothetical protein